MTWSKQLLGFRRVTIDRGDTLRAIALRELGDASLWTQLASINNLDPPYIVDDITQVTSTRILVAGQSISIPAPVASSSGVADENSLLGTDLELVEGMLTDDGAGDIGTVSGYDNLKQAIDHRLRTRPGELIYHPKYGCRVFTLLGQQNGPTDLQLAAAWVAKACRSDPRVTDVQNATASTTGDTIVVSASVTPNDGKPLPVGATLKS